MLRQPPGQHSSVWGALEFSWTACSSRASRQDLPVLVVTCNSMVAVSFPLPKRGKFSIPPEHEKFPPFAGGMLALWPTAERCLLTLETSHFFFLLWMVHEALCGSLFNHYVHLQVQQWYGKMGFSTSSMLTIFGSLSIVSVAQGIEEWITLCFFSECWMAECELPAALSRKKWGVGRSDICTQRRIGRWIISSWNAQSSFIWCGSSFEGWGWWLSPKACQFFWAEVVHSKCFSKWFILSFTYGYSWGPHMSFTLEILCIYKNWALLVWWDALFLVWILIHKSSIHSLISLVFQLVSGLPVRRCHL